MTLPNRPGYEVRERRPPHYWLAPLQSNNNSPPPANSLPSTPPLQDQHLASLFPFLSAPMDTLKSEKILKTQLQETSMHDQQNGVRTRRRSSMFENLTPEEIQEKKNRIRTHRLLSVFMEFLMNIKKEGLSPSCELLSTNSAIEPGTLDFSLDDFLESQGIYNHEGGGDDLLEDDEEYMEEDGRNVEQTDFLSKVEQLKKRYNEELAKLNQVSSEFCAKMFNLLREQSTLRPLSDQETQLKMQGVQLKFDVVRAQLRQNVCNAIIALQKQYHRSKKKKKTLSKKASEILTQWFFDHISDPYPTEEEKAMLAAAGNLTLTQVNNWFGNKRIRYKRKCLEQEGRGHHRPEFIPNEVEDETSTQPTRKSSRISPSKTVIDV